MSEKTPTVCVDIDGVLATGTVADVYSDKAGWAYERCTPITTGIHMVRRLVDEGVVVVLHTARPECDRLVTTEWLHRNGVPCARLVMDKPRADAYLDDLSWPSAFNPHCDTTDIAIDHLLNVIKNRGDKGP